MWLGKGTLSKPSVMRGDPAKILPKVYQADFLYELEIWTVV